MDVKFLAEFTDERPFQVHNLAAILLQGAGQKINGLGVARYPPLKTPYPGIPVHV